MGHEFTLIDLKDFSFSIENGVIRLPQLQNLGADLVIMRGIFNSIKAISVVVNDLRKKGVRIFDNNFLEHRYSIDKVTDIIKVSLASIPVPDTSYIRDFKNYPQAVAKIGYPVVIKSTRMGKGANVFKIDSDDQLSTFIAETQNEEAPAKGFIIQKFIDYKYDLRCLIIGDSVFTMRRIPVQGEFRANFSLGGKVEAFDLDDVGRRMAINALNAVDMSVGGVDILIGRDDSRYILEVNHTAGFVGMEKATGQNIGKLYVEHAIKNAK